MSQVVAWIYSPLAQAVGWTLLHFVWEGAALALVLAAALWLAGTKSRRRYALACTVLALMPVAFGGTVVVLWSRQPAQVATVVIRVPAAQATGIPGNGAEWVPAPPRLSPAGVVYRWGWVVPVWLAGVAFCFARALAGWMGVRRLRRSGICVVPREWQERFSQLAARSGITRAVALFESCLTDVPVMIGYLRPVVLLPVGCLSGLPAGQVECILLHELAHIRRHDYLVNLIQSAVEGLLYYHPAVWWVSGVVRAERENCCDDAVVELVGDARRYAVALAVMEERRAPDGVLAATGGNLMTRIRRLVGANVAVPSSAAPAAVAAVLLVTFAAGLLALPAKKPAPLRARRTSALELPLLLTRTEAALVDQVETGAEGLAVDQGPAAPLPSMTHEQPARVFSSDTDLHVSVIVPVRSGLIAVGDVLGVTMSTPPDRNGQNGNLNELERLISAQAAVCQSLLKQLQPAAPRVAACKNELAAMEGQRTTLLSEAQSQDENLRAERAGSLARLNQLREQLMATQQAAKDGPLRAVAIPDDSQQFNELQQNLQALTSSLARLRRNKADEDELAQVSRALDEAKSRIGAFPFEHQQRVQEALLREAQSSTEKQRQIDALLLEKRIAALDAQLANPASIPTSRRSLTVPVRADGRIAIEGAGDFQAAGFSLPQLQEVLNSALGQGTVTVAMQQAAQGGAGSVTVVVPLSGGTSHVYGQITHAGKLVSSFEDDISGSTAAKVITLRAGVYTLHVVSRNLQSKVVQNAKLEFHVD